MKKLINSRQNHRVIEVVFYSVCLGLATFTDWQEGQPAASEVLDTPDSGALLPSSMAAEAREQAQPWPGFFASTLTHPEADIKMMYMIYIIYMTRVIHMMYIVHMVPQYMI